MLSLISAGIENAKTEMVQKSRHFRRDSNLPIRDATICGPEIENQDEFKFAGSAVVCSSGGRDLGKRERMKIMEGGDLKASPNDHPKSVECRLNWSRVLYRSESRLGGCARLFVGDSSYS